jgi:hypothetical protein
MRRAPAALLVAVLALSACGRGAVPHRTWVTRVCQALGPWRDQLTTLNGQAAAQMRGATTPAQAREHLLRLLDGARQASEDARAKVAGAGIPDVADGVVIEQRFVDALAAVRDAYGKAQHAVQQLSDGGFYAGVQQAMDKLNQEYARAGVDTGRLASADLRKDFDEVPACG